MDELKPCPFCGGEAELIHDPLPGFFVSCKSCNAVVGSLKEDAAIEKWNRRAKDEP